jgi:hypothetical protein
MSITDNPEPRAPVKAMPLIDVEKLTLQCAVSAVSELNKYNVEYVANNKETPDNFDYVDLDQMPTEENPAVKMLARHYLVLLNRRGLVDF